MNAYVAVAIGGAIGSVTRYGTGIAMRSAITRGALTDAWPLATFVVNVIGCFLIGVFIRNTTEESVARAALTAGFCGGFTTFSAFSVETIAMLQQGRIVRAAAYVGASVALGILATALGMRVGAR